MTKYRTEITGHGEYVWSHNACLYDTIGEARDWLDGLASRWSGFDASRIVPDSTPRGEPFNAADPQIVHNFK